MSVHIIHNVFCDAEGDFKFQLPGPDETVVLHFPAGINFSFLAGERSGDAVDDQWRLTLRKRNHVQKD